MKAWTKARVASVVRDRRTDRSLSCRSYSREPQWSRIVTIWRPKDFYRCYSRSIGASTPPRLLCPMFWPRSTTRRSPYWLRWTSLPPLTAWTMTFYCPGCSPGLAYQTWKSSALCHTVPRRKTLFSDHHRRRVLWPSAATRVVRNKDARHCSAITIEDAYCGPRLPQE